MFMSALEYWKLALHEMIGSEQFPRWKGEPLSFAERACFSKNGICDE